MVSEDSSCHSNNNNILHEFVTSNQFENHNFHGYGAESVPNSRYSNSLPLSITCLAERMSQSVDIVHGPQMSDDSDVGPGTDRHLIDLLGPSSEAAAAQQLSLSLGSVPQRSLGYMGFSDGSGFSTPCSSLSQPWIGGYGTEPFATAVGGSKYLQPAQSLLEEMLSLGEGNLDNTSQKYMEKLSNITRRGSFSVSSKLKSELSSCEFLIEKHEDYVTLLKLIALLEEVERRYDDYSHHMEQLVGSFEAIAGLGAAKSYTGLALLAMSKHFCRLRKAILLQIHATKQKIVKDMPKISSRLSQLSLFDQEARQNRMMMQNSVQAWRPLRGLPETSVTVLRAWLFEHFLHPYPNDSEKLMLAAQTGLSKNQVSNWFINARVRLWKPMIEEMYKEEFEESSTECDQ